MISSCRGNLSREFFLTGYPGAPWGTQGPWGTLGHPGAPRRRRRRLHCSMKDNPGLQGYFSREPVRTPPQSYLLCLGKNQQKICPKSTQNLSKIDKQLIKNCVFGGVRGFQRACRASESIFNIFHWFYLILSRFLGWWKWPIPIACYTIEHFGLFGKNLFQKPEVLNSMAGDRDGARFFRYPVVVGDDIGSQNFYFMLKNHLKMAQEGILTRA